MLPSGQALDAQDSVASLHHFWQDRCVIAALLATFRAAGRFMGIEGRGKTAVRVLIVEDEALIALHLASMLEDAGHEVVGLATDTAEALEFAESCADLALLDVNLADGATGARLGETLACDHGMHVIFVTANPHQLGHGVPGTLGVLGKPCDEQALLSLIAGVDPDQEGMPLPALQPSGAYGTYLY